MFAKYPDRSRKIKKLLLCYQFKVKKQPIKNYKNERVWAFLVLPYVVKQQMAMK